MGVGIKDCIAPPKIDKYVGRQRFQWGANFSLFFKRIFYVKGTLRAPTIFFGVVLRLDVALRLREAKGVLGWGGA